MPESELTIAAQGFWEEAEGFFRVVSARHKRPGVFGPELVHNLLCMALEKYAMAVLAGLGELPENHTFADLVGAMKARIPVAGSIESSLLELDDRTDLCSLEIRKVFLPREFELELGIEVGRRLRKAAQEVLVEGSLFPLALERDLESVAPQDDAMAGSDDANGSLVGRNLTAV